MTSDVVVIGAGLSGLVDAILLAEARRKVVVLEQHNIPGGYLQQFRRKTTIFDVGFHYMGSTQPGRPMRQFLEHLEVWDRISVIPFPEDSAIEVVSGASRFGYPTRFDRFHEKARETWPGAREAVDRIVADVRAVCGQFRWFDLKRGKRYQNPREIDFTSASLAEYLAPFVADPWLKEVLSFQTFNLGLFSHEVPWVKYALAFRSNFDLTCRIDGGGGALVDALVARGKALGVEYRFRSEVAAFECEGRRVTSVTTAEGERFQAGIFIAACHPKQVVKRIRDEDLHPMFKERILEMKDSRGAVQVFLRLREPLRSIGASCIMLHDKEEAAKDVPIATILVTNPCAVEKTDRGGPRLEAMTYMEHDPFARWADCKIFKRGPEYDHLKGDLAKRMIEMIARIAPELPDLIVEVYSATPLSDEWYTKNEHGAVFGISHDVSQQGSGRPQPRTRLKNLYFTGHSIMMPGICGVFINAFDTCGMILGTDDLFHAVATDQE